VAVAVVVKVTTAALPVLHLCTHRIQEVMAQQGHTQVLDQAVLVDILQEITVIQAEMAEA
jgi:hypothetical protein